MLYERIGRQIHKYRIRNGLTQEMLSEMAGISLSFLGHIERGTRKLSVDTLFRLAKALECSADDLLGLQLLLPEEESSVPELLRLALKLLEAETPPKK